MNNFFRSYPMFVGSAIGLSFIFVEAVGDALYLFVFSKRRWKINHTFEVQFEGVRIATQIES